LAALAVSPRRAAPPPWAWVSTLYLAEGLPYVLVNTVSVVLYKRLGLPNETTAWVTSWLYLPWVVKPLWGPVVDVLKTKRVWIVAMQLLLGAGLACVALAIPAPHALQLTLAGFWLVAFSSATHDIAVDGFYMLGLAQHEQAVFVGIRSAFYRIGMVAGQGGLVVLAGWLERRMTVTHAWSIAFGVSAAAFIAFALYHQLLLPRPEEDRAADVADVTGVLRRLLDVFALFFKKEGIVVIVAFLLLYRFAEAQLVKLISPFLLDPRSAGGLGLSTEALGLTYGTVGVLALVVGGVLGGWVISRHGLKAWLWPMVLAIHLPDLAYVLLSQLQPSGYALVNVLVAVEQFGYGFGFTAYALFMIKVSEGPYKTAHFALCTGLMALGMMLPGLFSGAIQHALGYRGFFLWVMVSTVPGFLVAALVRVDPGFGRKQVPRPT
jgi:PAT family beta-lactamase induction signal transducer AmpG